MDLRKIYQSFSKKHPYLNVLLGAIIASILGITVEYLINNDFVTSGFWTVLFLVVLQIITIRIRKK